MKAYELFDPRDGITRRVVFTKWAARWATRSRFRLTRGKHSARIWDYQQVDR